MTRSIVLLATGGTIACTLDGHGAAVRTLSAADLLASAAVPPGVEVLPVDAEAFSSWNIDPPTMLALARQVDELVARHDADGVVVTHGTDTIEETAYMLDLVVASSAPVVVTGAMRNASLPGADGPHNLAAAFALAAHPGLQGCYVLLSDEVHAAADVTKAHSTHPATFTSPWLGPLGMVDGRTVAMLRERPVRRRYDTVRADACVPLLKVAAGMGPELARAAVSTDPDGVVVEGTGVGHLPAAWLSPLRDATARAPVVLATRAGAGPVRAEYGGPGGGFEVRDAGLIPSGRRPGLKARIELICALGAGLDVGAISRAFDSP